MATLVFCEDDPTLRRLIGAALRASRHEVHVAADGVEGLALIERLRPAAVFTDVAMPGMDGFALLDAIRGRPELAPIPVILVTALLQRAQIAEGYARGATAILGKPFSTAELRAYVDRYAGGMADPGGGGPGSPGAIRGVSRGCPGRCRSNRGYAARSSMGSLLPVGIVEGRDGGNPAVAGIVIAIPENRRAPRPAESRRAQRSDKRTCPIRLIYGL